MDLIKHLLSSKKFIATLLGFVIALAARFGFEVSYEELLALVSPFIAYILGQGIADFGKEAKKIENGG